MTVLVLEPRDTAALLEVIRGLRAHIQRSRTAFVVPRPIDYVVAHMLVGKMRCSEQQHQTFRQLDPALNWLGCIDAAARLQRFTEAAQAG